MPISSTGVQIVSCIFSGDSVLSESTGLFNMIFRVSRWNISRQKHPIRLCLSNHGRLARKLFNLHLVTSTYFGKPNSSIISNMTLKYDLFLNGISLVIIAVLVKATFMHCPLQKREVNKAGFHADWHHVTVRQSEHTKYSTYHQQRTGSKWVIGNRYDKRFNWGFNNLSVVSAIECTSISGWRSGG